MTSIHGRASRASRASTGASRLDDVFDHLLDGLLHITEGSSESDQVEVMDL
jgi:hypothetical protein